MRSSTSKMTSSFFNPEVIAVRFPPRCGIVALLVLACCSWCGTLALAAAPSTCTFRSGKLLVGLLDFGHHVVPCSLCHLFI